MYLVKFVILGMDSWPQKKSHSDPGAAVNEKDMFWDSVLESQIVGSIGCHFMATQKIDKQ